MSRQTVAKFEKAIAGWLGADAAFAFWRGRVAMYAAVRALGIGEGDEVILPGFTCASAVNPIKQLGAKPVYVDIDGQTYGAVPEQIEAKITPRTKCIFAQFTFGIPPEMDAIQDISKRHGIPIVEDACQGLGVRYKGRPAGSFGVAAAFSMQWTKTWTFGIGGMLVTNDKEMIEKVEAMRGELCWPKWKDSAMLGVQRMIHRAVIYPATTAMIRRAYRWLARKKIVVGSAADNEMHGEFNVAPDFYRSMSPGQARSGLRQLKGALDRNLAHRRRMRTFYDNLLESRGLPKLEIPDYMDPALVRYPVRVADKAKALELAKQRGIELGEWFDQPLHQAPVPLAVYDYAEGSCPVAEQAVREVVNLPTHIRVSDRHATKAVDLVCEIGPPA